MMLADPELATMSTPHTAQYVAGMIPGHVTAKKMKDNKRSYNLVVLRDCLETKDSSACEATRIVIGGFSWHWVPRCRLSRLRIDSNDPHLSN